MPLPLPASRSSELASLPGIQVGRGRGRRRRKLELGEGRESGVAGARPASARRGPEPAPSRLRTRPAQSSAAKRRAEEAAAAAAGKGLRRRAPRPRPDLGRPPAQVVLTTEEPSPSPFVLGTPRGPPAARPGGSALPRPPPAAGARKRASWAWPGRCRPLATPPPRLACSPRGAASCWGGGRREAPAAASPRRAAGTWGLAWCQGVLRTAAPRGCSLQPTPPGPRLAHSPHACTLLAGGDAALPRAGAQSDGHALRRPGRAPAATPVHTRDTRARGPSTRALTHPRTHTGTHSPSVHLVPGARPHATGGPAVGPGTSPPL